MIKITEEYPGKEEELRRALTSLILTQKKPFRLEDIYKKAAAKFYPERGLNLFISMELNRVYKAEFIRKREDGLFEVTKL